MTSKILYNSKICEELSVRFSLLEAQETVQNNDIIFMTVKGALELLFIYKNQQNIGEASLTK